MLSPVVLGIGRVYTTASGSELKTNSVMEKEQLVWASTTKNSSDPAAGPITTLSRWSSEPTSLSSGGDEPASGADLLERTWRSVATLRHALAAERDRCRRLEARLEVRSTALTPTTVNAILRCSVEHERAENRQLHATVARQRRTITKQRRQLRLYQLRPNVDDNSISSEDDRDDNMSHFQTVSLDHECSNCTADNGHRMVNRSQSDDVVSSRSRSSRPCPSQSRSPAVAVAVGGPGRAIAERPASVRDDDDDDADTLRRRLQDTVDTCQRLATALDARQHGPGGPTTHDCRETSSSNRSTHRAGQLPTSVNKIMQDGVDTKQTSCSAVDLTTTDKAKLSAVESRLKEVEEMNARWQCYVEQREKYTRALEQRCCELEREASQHQQHQHSL